MARFIRVPTEVDARRCSKFEVIDTTIGPMAAVPGDWIVRNVDGDSYVVRDRDFRRFYDPADGRAKQLLEQPVAFGEG